MAGLFDKILPRRNSLLQSPQDRWHALADSAPVGSVNALGGLLQPPQKEAPRNALNGLLGLSSVIPGVGDVTGLLGDAAMYATEPESRTKLNYLLTLLGALPGIPSTAAILSMPRPKWAGNGMDVSVGVDPTLPEMRELLDETGDYASKDWRGVLRTMQGPDGKRYVWPVGDAQHDDVAAHFGLSRDPRDHGGLMFSEDVDPSWRPKRR